MQCWKPLFNLGKPKQEQLETHDQDEGILCECEKTKAGGTEIIGNDCNGHQKIHPVEEENVGVSTDSDRQYISTSGDKVKLLDLASASDANFKSSAASSGCQDVDSTHPVYPESEPNSTSSETAISNSQSDIGSRCLDAIKLFKY